MRSKRIVALLSIVTLAIVAFSGVNQVSTLPPVPSNLNTGPYVDNILYKVIASQDQRILALLADNIETEMSFIDPMYLPPLKEDPNIDIYQALRNGYGEILINCAKYPLNIAVFRRAFAYAFNKTAVTTEVLSGLSQEHDSVVPFVNSWCVEDYLPYHYYTDQSALGNTILDAAGFAISGETGYRLAPNGSVFSVNMEYPSTSTVLGYGIAQIAAEALSALHVQVNIVASDFSDYISRLDSHGNYDMIFMGKNFEDNDVDWLAYDFWSENADEPYQNPTNFANATYDSWRNQLLYGTTFEDIYEAAAEMQMILHQNVPLLVVYENIYFQAYRIDEFEGYVEDYARYSSGLWTMRKIHTIGMTLGGTFAVGMEANPDSFNIYTANSEYSKGILEELWPSLYKTAPDLTPWPDLASNLLVETNADNTEVPVGHTRYTIDIIQNATWSDGIPLTAEDVAYTFMYVNESFAYGNPAGVNLVDVVAAYAPTPYRFVIEFNSESYWQFSSFAYDFIIPKHIFQDIGFNEWNTWNPVYNPDEPYVTCGPFYLSDYELTEFFEISRNPLFHYRDSETTSTTITTTTTTTTTSTPPAILSALGTTYIVGTTGHIVYWDVYDNDPYMYSLLVDGAVNETGFWDGSDFAINVDGHLVGTYNYTLILFDYALNMVSSTVFVTVLPATTSTTSTTTTITTTTETSNSTSTGTTSTSMENPDFLSNISLIISAGSALVILVVVIIIAKQR